MLKKILTLLAAFYLLPHKLLAQGADFGLSDAAPAQLPQADLEVIAANVIQVVLGFVGVFFLVMIIFSGFQWMTSGGNEQKITAAKNRLVGSATGLLIILTAYAITYWITAYLLEATGTGG